MVMPTLAFNPMAFLQKLMRSSLIRLGIPACLLLPSSVPFLAAAETDNQYLDMDLAELMQVTIITSVSKKPQALADTPAAVFVITQEDIRRSGVTSIPEALAMAPGLQVARISASKWSITSRGFGGYTSNKLLVMIDGRSVYSPAYSGTLWDMQNTLIEDIDRIEVIRGPGGTIWGANAVNGVINIITKQARDTRGGLVRVGIGDQEKLSTGARYGGKIGDTAFGRFYVTTSDHDSNVLAGSDADADDGWQNVQGGFRMDGTSGSRNEWTLQGDLYKNDGDQIFFPFWIDSSRSPMRKYGEYTAKGNNLNGNWKHRTTGGDRLTFNAYYDTNSREENYGETYTTLDLNLQHETSIGSRNSLTTGAGYRHVDGDFDSSFQVRIPDQTNDLYNAFVQDEIKLIPERLWLTLGTKYEHNAYTGSEWQPGAHLLWKPATDHSLWTAVARAVRTPSIIDHSGVITIGVIPAIPPATAARTIDLRGHSGFDSEVLIAYEAGYRWQAKRNLALDAAVYYNDYDAILAAIPSSPSSRNLLFSNALHGAGYGFEFAADWKTNSWLSLIFTYSLQYLDLELNDPSQQTSIGDSIYEKNNPRHQPSVRSAIDFAENWQFNCWLRYVDEIDGRNNATMQGWTPVDAYFLLNANLIWKPRNNLEVMLAGQNLLNSGHLEYITELSPPATEIERGFYGKVTWRF